MKNIIFLDVDGVLNNKTTKERSPMGFVGIDDKLVHILKQITEENNASIVLSSTWKSDWDADYNKCLPDGKYLVDKLRKENIEIQDKIDVSEVGEVHRGAAICNWLRNNEYGAWIVLDDEIFPDFKIMRSHVLQTSYSKGLTNRHIRAAKVILEAQKERD